MTDWNAHLCALTGVPQEDVLAMSLEDHAAIFYDPSACENAGYFPTVTLMQFAEIRCRPFQPEAGLNPLMQSMLILASATYNGQGFCLANLVPNISEFLTAENDTRKIPHRLIENTVCFATCLGLRVMHQSPEQIIATYGTLMSQSFRKKIRQACRQIDSYDAELKLLQILAKPNAENLTDAHWGPRAISA